MKVYKKMDNNFICEECGKKIKTKDSLSRHINKYHNIKNYYDIWLKEEGDGLCKTCGKETIFNKLKGYREYCNTRCVNTNINIRNKIKQTNLKRYGIENFNNIDKRQITNLKIYGVKNGFESKVIKDKIKETCLQKYGVENSYQIKNIRDKALSLAHSISANKKRENTMLKNWGFKNSMSSLEIKNKIKQTNLKKYGYEYTHQNKDILEKAQKSAFKLKQFKDTTLWYQGSYELDFLEKYYDKYPDIQRGPSIRYIYEGKNKVYHPDFYIPSLNLIIEIKSSYYYKKYLNKNLAKEKAINQLTFKYILILDKNGTI